MKLFCRKKDKVVRVKIINESLSLNTPAPSVDAKSTVNKMDYELALKLAAVISLVLNSLLAIMGYVDFTGRLETLGISTNEIDLGLPTLLFQGYLAVVLGAFNAAAEWSPWGAIALTLIPAALLYLSTGKLINFQSWVDRSAFSMLLTLGLLLISIIPTVGLMRGEQSAYQTLRKHGDVTEDQKIIGLRRELTIKTKEGSEITGETIFASTLYTYVLQDKTLFKVANRDNHIVSTTLINPMVRSKLQDKAAAQSKPPKAES